MSDKDGTDGGDYAQKDVIKLLLGYVNEPVASGVDCINPAIPTGVQVYRQKYNVSPQGLLTPAGPAEEFPEKICPTPGCYYNNTTDRCVK